MANTYKLRCLGDGALIEDKWYDDDFAQGNLLANPHFDGDALLRSEYEKPLQIDNNKKNIFRYSWLPIKDEFDCSTGPIAYKSKGLAGFLGLKNLYCTFSGYAPKRGAYNRTGTFKEFETVGVVGRHGLDNKASIVLASAGNTARAFAEIVSNLETSMIIVVPEFALEEVWTTHANLPRGVSENISLFYVPGGDYTDAIKVANIIAGFDGFVAEGGVRNVGRRDGMGTALLAAVECMGRVPDHYFQAVGSGSGAISAWEASLRYKHLMGMESSLRVHIAQNIPFTPLVDSWEAGSPTLLPLDEALAYKQIAEINAKVLSNRMPPYSVVGGMYDALKETKGFAYRVTNEAAAQARDLFWEKEQLRLDAASAVTCASLLQALTNRQAGGKTEGHTHIGAEHTRTHIKPDDYILLHITGGGQDEIGKSFDLQRVRPTAKIPIGAQESEVRSILRTANICI